MVNDFNFNSEDQRLIDLLVDGELPPDERRELLNRFEQEPAGWRRCALAFLEAQSWSGDLRALLKEPAPARPLSAVSPAVPPARGGRGSGWLLPLYTLAAALLVALGVGVGWKLRPGGGSGAEQFAGPRAGSTWTVGHGQPQPRRAQNWGHVNLVLDPGNNRADSQVQVPVVEGQGVDDRWLRDQPSPVPSDVVRALEQMGNQVHQQRRLVPFRLDDGRQLVVPVDQVDVRPVDLRAFQ